MQQHTRARTHTHKPTCVAKYEEEEKTIDSKKNPHVPAKRGRVRGSDGIRRRVNPCPGLVEVAEDGGRQEGRGLDQVGAAAALHPHGDPRDRTSLLRFRCFRGDGSSRGNIGQRWWWW